MTLCPGVPSDVNPSRPMHLCVDCKRHAWWLPGTGPAVHDGRRWVCDGVMPRGDSA